MGEFDYSKCTYKELNTMLRRFKSNAVDYKDKCYYSTLASREYSLIKKCLYKSRYIDSNERYERYYNDEKIKLSKLNNIREINIHTSLRRISCSSQQEDSAMIDGIEKAIRERVEELKLRDNKKERIKYNNKRRFFIERESIEYI